MMPLPQKFDQNEWFIIISLAVGVVTVILLPRRFPLSVSILMMVFAATVARTLDHLLAGPTVDVYNITDTGRYDLFDLITYTLYAPFAYIFVYIFDRFNIKGYWILLYVVIASLLGTLYEWLCVVFDVFNYKGWNIKYSYGFYLSTQPLTLLFFRYIMGKAEGKKG